MSHCRVLTCDREATTAFALWPVCGAHGSQLNDGAEYRQQGSEQSALGMSPPMLLMGQQLRELNEFIVVEPPTQLKHEGDCPEGSQLPLRVRQRGDTETGITLVLPQETLTRLATMLRKYDPERASKSSMLNAKEAFLHVANEFRYLSLAGSGRRLYGPSGDAEAQRRANELLPGVGVPLLDSLLLHARSLIEFFIGSRRETDIGLARFDNLDVGVALYERLKPYKAKIEVHVLHLTEFRDTTRRAGREREARPVWDTEDIPLVEALLDALADVGSRAERSNSRWEHPFRLLHEASISLFADPTSSWPHELGEKQDVDAYLSAQGL